MKKRIALITGASRGIGKAVAMALAQNYHIALVSRDITALEKVVEEIHQAGGSADVYGLNVADAKAVQEVVDRVITTYGAIDVLFNNAGILHVGTIDVATQDIENLIQINLLGAIYMAKFVAEQMKKQGGGYIFNVSSMSGKRTHPTMGIYSASKFGLVGYSDSLFKLLAPYGVKVTAICPSFVATDMARNFKFPVEDMIRMDDIVATVQYLLNLGKNTAISTVNIECAPYVVQSNK